MALRVPGAAVAVMAAAATLPPGLDVAQDVYLRAGIDLSRSADTHFKYSRVQGEHSTGVE